MTAFAQRDPVAHKGLGLTYLQRGDFARAEQVFRTGLGIGPEKGEFLRGLGIAKLLQGDAVTAETFARSALSEDYPHVDSWRSVGIRAERTGET